MSEKDIERALTPYTSGAQALPENLYSQLARYLELLLKWNARTNLTAIRDPEEIVRRHLGESLFAAQHLGPCETLLDFGSGAGFPGLPIQLFLPELRVTLAESQNKKASFLREAVRTLQINTEVWAGRVEMLPEVKRFDVITLRAVDNMEAALHAASFKAEKRIVVLATTDYSFDAPANFIEAAMTSIPETTSQHVLRLDRMHG